MSQISKRLQAARAADAALMRDAISLLDLRPDVVIDVGVRAGTPPLYEAFPNAHFHLVDPQEGGESELESRPANYTFHAVALGAEVGRLTLHESGAQSSLLERTPLTQVSGGTRREVNVTTLDLFIDALTPATRIVLKLDTEGFELEILKGLNRHADRIDMMICETSVRDRFVGSYQFADLIAAADARGFRFYNVLNIPKPKPKRFYDLMFLRHDSAFFAR